MKAFDKINYYRNIQAVVQNNPFREEGTEAVIFACDECTHMQTEYMLANNYYDEEQADLGYSQYYGDLQHTSKKLEKLASYLEFKSSLFEIGCGSGNALLEAEKYWEIVKGCDASEYKVNCAVRKGLSVTKGYFNKNLKIKDRFSAFCSFQVLEHVEDLYAILNYAYEILLKGGVGLINVPNGQEIIEKRLYHQMIMEHINYYTPFSLAYACKRAGFQILEIEPIKDTIELDIYVRKPLEWESLEEIRSCQIKQVNNYIKDCKMIGIYGAGAKAGYYSSLIDCKKVKYIFDGDKRKFGNYISGIPVPIEGIDEDKLRELEAVVIFSSSYNLEILKILKEDYKYKGRIIYFEDYKVICD